MPRAKDLIILLATVVGSFTILNSAAYAATITVTSTADTALDDGACTFREAIIAANTDATSGATDGECGAGSGTDTINFIISGPADFINSGQSGYTISPGSVLPAITERATIDGHSQPGSQHNSAIAPRPFNDIKLIEIDGSGASSGGLEIRADNSIVRDLVINGFDGTGLLLGGDNIGVYGNYIGVEPDGMSASSNQLNGINQGTSGFTDPDGALIGSTNPADRNIVSGNGGAGITPNTGQDDWVILGNYVGMAADGKTPIPNSTPYTGPGGFSIDNNARTTVGGSAEGSTNLISGNRNFGIFPDNTTELVIQGNIIGPDWQGNPIENNPQIGGVGFPPYNGDIENTLIGGTSLGEGNIIAYNNGTGIAVMNLYLNGLLLGESKNIAVLGNSIHNNLPNENYIIAKSGLGIDIMDGEFSDQSSTTIGPTPNDLLDADTGPNGYINFPVLNAVAQSGTQATINYSLDAADSPTGQYRVEFFSNNEADPSGYGEGQTLLGAVTATNGNNQTASLTLPAGIDLAHSYISATATALDAATSSGFGATSEFSRAFRVGTDGSLAATGERQMGAWALLAVALICTMGAGLGTLATRHGRAH